MSPGNLLAFASECERHGLDRMIVSVTRRKRPGGHQIMVLPTAPGRKRVLGKILSANGDRMFVSLPVREVKKYLEQATKEAE